jgi:hypothetical protein
MYKDLPFNFNLNNTLQFSVFEKKMLRHIYRNYFSNKIFYQPLNTFPQDNRLYRKLEKSLNLRICILYFYCNPLYKQPFDGQTISSVFEKLKKIELNIINQLPESETKRNYQVIESELPVFLLRGELKNNSGPCDLKRIYNGILELESVIENENFRQKFQKLLTILSIAIRLPFVGLIRAFKIRKSITSLFRHIDSINILWKTINKMSFQMNFLVFKKGLSEIIRGRSEIVDLSILVMLIGDDFIDQIARNKGCEKIITLISLRKDAFEIKINADCTLQSNDLVSLYKSLHIEKENVSDNDNMTFNQLYEVMLEIFSEINRRLLKMSMAKRETTSKAICGFLNYCLSTYMDDLLFSTREKEEKFSLTDISWYFYKKNNCVMMYGLWLRALLLDLNYEKFLPQIREWGSLVENIQLYDDLKDMNADWNYQPNYPLILSFEYFRDEYHWFEKNMNNFSGSLTSEQIVQLSLAMPKTVAHTMLLSKFKGISRLNWFTKFATNYCWKQNWTRAFLPFKNIIKSNAKIPAYHRILSENSSLIITSSKEVNLVFLLISKTISLFETFEKKEFYFDYMLLLCLYDSKFSRSFYAHTKIVDSYHIIFRLQFMQTGYRTKLLNNFMKQKTTAVQSAIQLIGMQSKTGKAFLPDELLKYIQTNWI